MKCRSCSDKAGPSRDARNLELCDDCMRDGEMENEHNDGHHRDEPVTGCIDCEQPVIPTAVVVAETGQRPDTWGPVLAALAVVVAGQRA